MSNPSPNSSPSPGDWPAFNREKALCYTPGNLNIPLKPMVAARVAAPGGTFVLGAWLPDAINEQPKLWYSPADMLKAFITHKYRGHELVLYDADYDMRYFLPELERLTGAGFDTAFTCGGDGKIMHVKVKRGKHAWYIRDLLAVLPLTMQQLARLAGVDREPAPGEFDAWEPEHIAQLQRDCGILIRAYKVLSSTLRDTFGVRPAVSAGSSGLRSFLTTLPENHVHFRQRAEVESTARAAYFGGLVFVQTTQERPNVTKIDVNAMYAHSMRQGVPTRSGGYSTVEYPGQPGIYDCTVHCPAWVAFPFVPYRDEYGRVRYPRGRFNTTLCSHTIELARSVGYEIVVNCGFVFEGLEPVFDEFVNKCEALELEYKAKGAGMVIKILRNSLYGKFGQRPKIKEYFLTQTPTDDMTQVLTFEGDIIDNLWWRETMVERSHMMPHWAAWITAGARNMLARAVYALDPNRVWYGDTDSIVVDNTALESAVAGGRLELGAKYGQWKIEQAYTRFRALAAKMYLGYTVAGSLVSVDTRSAGIPRAVLTPGELERLLPSGPGLTTRDYVVNHRALNTVGGRPHSTVVHSTIAPPSPEPARPGPNDYLVPYRVIQFPGPVWDLDPLHILDSVV